MRLEAPAVDDEAIGLARPAAERQELERAWPPRVPLVVAACAAVRHDDKTAVWEPEAAAAGR